MEINEVLREIENLKYEINCSDKLLSVAEEHGIKLIVVASNNSSYRGLADKDFLVDALKSKRSEMHERLVKLIDAVSVAEKVIGGLVT